MSKWEKVEKEVDTELKTPGETEIHKRLGKSDRGKSLTFDRDDELRHYGQYLRSTRLQHVLDALLCKEIVRMFRLAQPIKEQW